MAKVFLSVGSNLGDRAALLRQAVARLPQIRFRVSRETGPASADDESIVLVEPNPADPSAVQASQRPS